MTLNNIHWFALQTRPRWEKKVASSLNKKGIEHYCPLNKVVRQWSDRKKVVLEPVFKCYVFIKIAEDKNINIQLGGFLESRLAFTAAAHVALSSDAIVHCDFDTPLMFEEDPVIGGIGYGNKGEVKVPEVKGLGATFDETYLNKLRKVVV